MKYFNRNQGDTRQISFLSQPMPGFAAATLLTCLMLLLALPSCKKDFQFDKVKDLSWNPDIALPLVNDSITLKRILTQGKSEKRLYFDESGNISILYYYNNDAFRIRPADLIKIPPAGFSILHRITQTEQEQLSLADLSLSPVDFPLALTGSNPETRIDKLLIKKGTIGVNTNHTFDNDGYLVIRILNATKNGKLFSDTLRPIVSGPQKTNIDISGVLFDLTSSPNTVNARVEGLLKKSGNPVAGKEINAAFELRIDTIGWFEGYLGRQTIPQLMDTVTVNVFNNAYTLGELYFLDPQAIITIVNSIGIPTEITIEKLVAINGVTGSTLDIADRLGSGSVISVPSPLITATHSITKTTVYNNDNTGNAMYDFFNLKPDNAAFQVSTVINPGGPVLNFFSDTSSFYGDLRIKLPLWGHFDNLTFQDTFDLSIDKPEELEHLEFRTHIANGLPLTALMQVYFTDADYNKKDSLAGDDKILIREAPVDPSTYLPYPGMFGIKDTTYILNMQRMQNLKTVKKMLVRAVLHSANGGQADVKLKAEQTIQIHFSARAKLRKAIEISK
jgi:hypothetical protein